MSSFSDLLAAPTTLYRFFNADDELLYVGIAVRFEQRRLQHQSDKTWWPEVARWVLAEHPCRLDAALAERDAIIAELPRYNVMHHPDRRPTARIDGFTLPKGRAPKPPKKRSSPPIVEGASMTQEDWAAFMGHIEAIGAGFAEARNILYDLLMDRDMVHVPILTTREELTTAQAAQRRRMARGTALETKGDDPIERRHERAR